MSISTLLMISAIAIRTLPSHNWSRMDVLHSSKEHVPSRFSGYHHQFLFIVACYFSTLHLSPYLIITGNFNS